MSHKCKIFHFTMNNHKKNTGVSGMMRIVIGKRLLSLYRFSRDGKSGKNTAIENKYIHKERERETQIRVLLQ